MKSRLRALRLMFEKKKETPEKPIPRPYPSWEELVAEMYDLGLNFSDTVLRVIYDPTHERRFILLRSRKGYVYFLYEELCAMDEDEWRLISGFRDTQPGYWNTHWDEGLSVFDTEERAMYELTHTPEYKRYFAAETEQSSAPPSQD